MFISLAVIDNEKLISKELRLSRSDETITDLQVVSARQADSCSNSHTWLLDAN